MKIIFRTFTFTAMALLFAVSHIAAANTLMRPDTADYYSENFSRTDNHVYKKSIHSVEIYRPGFELSEPVIHLGTDEQLLVAFDDLEVGFKQYYYTLEHCDATWSPSGIWVNEYLDGNPEGQIENYAASFNTRMHYTHYEFVFPDSRMRITKSGNYILKIYLYNHSGEQEVVVTRRFMVLDQQVSIVASAIKATTADDFDTRQKVDFKILTNGYRIDSPYQDITVVVLQNWRWDNAITTLKPYMVRNDVLDYAYDNGVNLFDGGNEFRHFDMKSVKFLSDKVKEFTYNDTVFIARLWDSQRRTFKVYVSDADINGRFLLKNDDEGNVKTMGEYAIVKFTLPCDAPAAEGNVYVAGGFNGWQYGADNKMTYNYQRKCYEASILLKQGYYDYLYVLLPNNSSVGDVTYLEGNHSSTGNTYTILVYHRSRGELYDQLIGATSIESGK